MDPTEEKIKKIQEEIRTTPYHKGTEHHIGRLRARLARLKDDQLFRETSGGGGGGFAVKKSGDATVVLVGFPSVGKSTLINKLTNANSKVAAYDFTTLDVIPGMLEYKGAKIQIFDIPGVIGGAARGRGRGKEIISVVKTSDLVLMVLDPKTKDRLEEIKQELYESGIRLNQSPPKILINKSSSGGIRVTCPPGLEFSPETVKQIAQEFRINNGEITIKERVTIEQLIDVFSGNRAYLPCFTVLNKIDKMNKKEQKKYYFDIFISAEKEIGIETLKELIWERLELIRVFLKPEGKPPDLKNPFILKKGDSLKNLLEKISICNKDLFKIAKVSGSGAKFPNQEVPFSFFPQDGTIIEFNS